MKKKDEKIVEKVFKEFTGYWNTGDAINYAPILFPFVEPNEKVRAALKALQCKKEKDERFRESRRSVEVEGDYHFFLRELEHILEREEMRYRKRFPEEKYPPRDYRDFILMLTPILASQKPSVNLTIDINELNKQIYGECEKCPIREICKEAFTILTEYVSYALKELDFEIVEEKEE